MSMPKEIKRDLPNGTPLVVNALYARMFRCKVFIKKYDPEYDNYSVITAEDYVDYEGYTTKKGTHSDVKRECFFDRTNIPPEWPKELIDFVNSAVSEPKEIVVISKHELVSEALHLLEMKLKRSKRKDDAQKLEFLQKETENILLMIKSSKK
jgi:hypothetical protein